MAVAPQLKTAVRKKKIPGGDRTHDMPPMGDRRSNKFLRGLGAIIHAHYANAARVVHTKLCERGEGQLQNFAAVINQLLVCVHADAVCVASHQVEALP